MDYRAVGNGDQNDSHFLGPPVDWEMNNPSSGYQHKEGRELGALADKAHSTAFSGT